MKIPSKRHPGNLVTEAGTEGGSKELDIRTSKASNTSSTDRNRTDAMGEEAAGATGAAEPTEPDGPAFHLSNSFASGLAGLTAGGREIYPKLRTVGQTDLVTKADREQATLGTSGPEKSERSFWAC